MCYLWYITNRNIYTYEVYNNKETEGSYELPPFVTHDKMDNNKNKKQEVKNICPFCKSENVIKWTKRKTQNRGLIQRYKCKDCGKTFTKDEGFFRMRNHPKKITCTLDLFY